MYTVILLTLLAAPEKDNNSGILYVGYTKIGKEDELKSTVPYRVVRNWRSKTITGSFVQGDNSPKLDKQATYLYLYQPGNDKNSAGKFDEFYIRLKSTQTLITSWGHFDIDLRNKDDVSKVPHSEYAPANASEGIVFVSLEEDAVNRLSPKEAELGNNFFRVKYDSPVESGNKVKTVGFTSNQPPIMSEISYDTDMFGSVPVPRPIPEIPRNYSLPVGDMGSYLSIPNPAAYSPNVPGSAQLSAMGASSGLGTGMLGSAGGGIGANRSGLLFKDRVETKETTINNSTSEIIEKCCDDDVPIAPEPASWILGVLGLLSMVLFRRWAVI